MSEEEAPFQLQLDETDVQSSSEADVGCSETTCGSDARVVISQTLGVEMQAVLDRVQECLRQRKRRRQEDHEAFAKRAQARQESSRRAAAAWDAQLREIALLAIPIPV
mmetsp:Transcript_15373/g.26597  ORF Transcript_15373/g.26597 Transcript_15373/m.26597 type:complete len:108 (-) Transcript_15373:77-400(-)